MPLEISRNDIRNISADAVVDPTDRFLSGSGGVDGIIHELAGKRLKDACIEIGSISTGEAVITPSYDLSNYRYIIHTCGPNYTDGKHDEAELLASCYRNSLELAKQYRLESIVFPLIASGSFSFPKGQALRTASDTITGFLQDNEMNVYLLVYDKESFDTAGKLYSDIRNYLQHKLVPKLSQSIHKQEKRKQNKIETYMDMDVPSFREAEREETAETDKLYGSFLPDSAVPVQPCFKEERFEPDESFSECLIRMIDERGLSDPDVYKKANIDRKHFNHIINTKDYRPKKETAVALAIGLKLNLNDTNTLLERAGFVLSDSIKFDLIIRYCIKKGIYNIFEINEILFEEDQKTLGC